MLYILITNLARIWAYTDRKQTNDKQTQNKIFHQFYNIRARDMYAVVAVVVLSREFCKSLMEINEMLSLNQVQTLWKLYSVQSGSGRGNV